MISFDGYEYTVAERFLRYVRIDTQSDPSSPTIPSTVKQKDLGRLLAAELVQLGLSDASLDAYGYVYATLPSNTEGQVPVICFCAHMDTAPDCSGAGVVPLLHPNYQGRDICLPDNPREIIKLENHPDLGDQIGCDLITASGNTLLGADNKAGIAAIMDAVRYLVMHPEIPHGKIRILFTVDEEIGRGVDHVDLSRLDAQYAYTIDGERAGSLEDETFCADAAIITVSGIAVHPGFAKGKMVNALKVAAAIVDKLPKDAASPETTEGRQGYIHPWSMEGNAEKATLQFLIRDFTEAGLVSLEDVLKACMERVTRQHAGSRASMTVNAQYRNMKQVLDRYPKVMELAREAIRRAGLEPVHQSIRGGTDGCRLTLMGLPCPNLFAGEHAFHSLQEWISVQDMQKAVQTICHLAALWAHPD
jgi:tripeptide aminopeptidase